MIKLGGHHCASHEEAAGAVRGTCLGQPPDTYSQQDVGLHARLIMVMIEVDAVNPRKDADC
jgi:hypothetical protein